MFFVPLFGAYSQWWPTTYPDTAFPITMIVKDNSVFAGAAWPYDSAIFRSDDDGWHWRVASQGLPVQCDPSAFALKDSFLFVVTSNGIYRSSNNGDSWTVANTDYKISRAAALIVSDTVLVVATGSGVSISSDDGLNWQLVGLTNAALSSAASIGSNIFIGKMHYTSGGPPGSIYLSTDNGNHWKTVNNGLSDSNALSMASVGSSVFVSNDSGDVYRSIDTGKTWQLIRNLPTLKNQLSTLYANGSNLFCGTPGGIYLSTDDGITWLDTKYSNGGHQVMSIAITSYMLFANGGFGGILARSLTGLLGVGQNTDRIPIKFALQQNYPNPFNPTTRIVYNLPHDCHVTLRVFNLLGQVVATIIDQYQTAGYKSVDYNGNLISSGVYFYRIDAASRSSEMNSFTQIKKMILIR